ncbi:MAG TPA: beta-L-arabinofuranosidase domain-containing protein, partial [Opitutus sp.]|nr:beta-L-arabinofuranosidase domain-containing protein [Opitutus sp.]
FFWNTVVDHRSLAFGGNSEREHFNATDNFGPVVESREGPETCNTYNMLRLTEALFRREPSARYADYYERALINHILSSQHPEHGGYVYFTPIRPRHYRVYSQPEVCFWCCVGSGMENHGKYGAFIYAHSENDLYVNLFIASSVEWRERGLSLRQDTHFPDTPSTRLTVTTAEPQRFGLRLRHPAWVAKDAFAIRVNGQAHPVLSSPSSYVSIEREWRNGDQIQIELPMRTSVERLPDGSDYVALLHGPVVLAAKSGVDELDGLVAGDARMGHVSPGPYLPLDEAPMLVGDVATIANQIRPVKGKPFTFTAASAIRPKEFQQMELVPFFRVHDARYMMYWRTVSAEKYPEVAAALAASEQSRLELEARTLDFIAPGEQQPEVEHGLTSEESQSGVSHGRRWRNATGWFSYKMKAGRDRPMELLVTYNTDERDRKFDILVNEQVIASVDLNGERSDQFVDVSYPIPAKLIRAANDTLTIKFAAKEKSRTASIFGVRLLTVGRSTAAP